MSKLTGREQKFIEYLENLVRNRDRGALADLRRGLRKPPGTVPQMDRHVLRFVPDDSRASLEEPYYIVASLFGLWHQGKDSPGSAGGNLGVSLRALVAQEKDASKRENTERSTEKRLVALLNCHRDDLSEHLRQVVSLLESRDVPVNWVQLLSDIKHWQRDDRPVQKAWARGFWIAPRQTEGDEPPGADIPGNKAHNH